MKTLYAEVAQGWMSRVESILELTAASMNTPADVSGRMFTANLDAKILLASMRGVFVADVAIAEPVRVDPASVTPATTLDFL